MTVASHRDGRWLLFAGAVLAFAAWSLVWALADIAAFRARVWTETWDNLAQAAVADPNAPFYDPSPDDWKQARWVGEWAVRLEPLSPDYRDVLSRVYASRYMSTPDGAVVSRPYLEEAAELSRQSIAMRPTWPYGYVALAQVLARMDRTDAEFDDSMRKALHYGPWEPDVLMAVIDMGLEHWKGLSPASRALVLETIRRGQAWTTDSEGNLVSRGDEIWARVALRHKQLVICAQLPMTDPQLQGRCNPASW